jgi:tetratricopeptide (TPR) repeat protein
MTTVLTAERDREVLRSFARRIDPSDAGAHNNLGVLYYNKGLHAEAAAAFMRALELDPKMQVAQRNLEIAYLHTGYYDRRVADLRDRLRSRPSDRDARWELGRTFSLLGQLPEAVAEFAELLRHHPSDVGALVQLALAEKSSGHLEQAQQWLERALALDPESSVINLYVGEILYNRGLNEESLEALRRATELNPDSADALYLMGFVLGDLGRHDEARAVTRRAVQLNPTLSRAQANLSLEQYRPAAPEAPPELSPPRRSLEMTVVPEEQLARFGLGLAFRQKGYYAEALREYQLALERGEDPDLVRQAMAEVYLVTGDLRAATALYEQLLETQPNSPKLWNERGVALHQEGRVAEAAESYRRAVSAEATYALALNNLGVAQYHLGDVDSAVEAFRVALQARPSFAKARLNLALLLVGAGRHEHALEAYRQVLAAEPEHPVAWNGVGLVLAEQHRFEEARTAFSRAIEARPEYAGAHYNLSFALSNLGDFEGALRETRRALELDPYYSRQKFELAIDLEYEDPDVSIRPELDGERRTGQVVADFKFDAALLDTLFSELAQPAPPPAPKAAPLVEASPYAIAADYLSKGLVDKAAAEASQALARGAPRGAGLALLGDAFSRQGLHGEALERYREARAEDPYHAGAAMGEAWALLRLGRAEEARPLAEAMLAEDPGSIERLMLAAAARAETRDPVAALEALERARQVAPERADVHHKIGDVAQSVGRFEMSIAAYREALRLDGGFVDVRHKLARALAGRGEVAEAEEELIAALEAIPTFAEATLELAFLWRMTDRPHDALALLVELLERDPYHFDALVSLGETLLELDRPADATTAFARVLRFQPDNVAALFHGAVLLARQGRYQDAEVGWRRVIDLGPESSFAARARLELRSRTPRRSAAVASPGP